MSGAREGQKKALNPLEVKLLTVMNYHVGAENQIWDSERVASAFSC